MNSLCFGASSLITPIGLGVENIAAAVAATVSAVSECECIGPDGEPFKFAAVPDALLAPVLSPRVANPRHSRMHKLAVAALQKTCELFPYLRENPLPLLLGLPEPMAGRQERFGSEFITAITQQAQCPVDEKNTRLFFMGRSALLYALDYAFALLQDEAVPAVIVGAVDSYKDPHLLALLESQGRLLTQRNSVGFIPAEGAGFMVVCRPQWAQQQGLPVRGHLSPPGVAEEPGHLYSQEPLSGQGLTQALRQARVNSQAQGKSQAHFTQVFSTLNGEPQQAKEIGIALMRNSILPAIKQHLHPIDCMGDMGAATAVVLLHLAALNNHHTSLVVSLSDGPFRGACCVHGV